MHLSLLSDSFLSDCLDDAGPALGDLPMSGRLHRDGVVRGLWVMALLAAPFVLMFGATGAERAAAAVSSRIHPAVHGMRAAPLSGEPRS